MGIYGSSGCVNWKLSALSEIMNAQVERSESLCRLACTSERVRVANPIIQNKVKGTSAVSNQLHLDQL